VGFRPYLVTPLTMERPDPFLGQLTIYIKKFMEPIEDTDRHLCEHCGYAGQVRHFRKPGKSGPNFVCPSCFFSTDTYYLYLEDKARSSPPSDEEFPGMAFLRKKHLSPELFSEYSRIEKQINARRASAIQPSSGSCMLLAVGLPAGLITICGLMS